MDKTKEKNCEFSRKWFVELLYDEKNVPEEIFKHLESCSMCKNRLNSFKALLDKIHSAGIEITPPEGLAQQIIKAINEEEACKRKKFAILQGLQSAIKKAGDFLWRSKPIVMHPAFASAMVIITVIGIALIFKNHGILQGKRTANEPFFEEIKVKPLKPIFQGEELEETKKEQKIKDSSAIEEFSKNLKTIDSCTTSRTEALTKTLPVKKKKTPQRRYVMSAPAPSSITIPTPKQESSLNQEKSSGDLKTAKSQKVQELGVGKQKSIEEKYPSVGLFTGSPSEAFPGQVQEQKAPSKAKPATDHKEQTAVMEESPPERMEEKYQQKKPIKSQDDSTVKSARDPYEEALNAYNNGKYDDVIKILSNIFQTPSLTAIKPAYIYHLLAKSWSKKGNKEKALVYYENILAKYPTYNYIDDVRWEASMLYLQMGDNKNARKLLEKLLESNKYREKAQKKLESLKN